MHQVVLNLTQMTFHCKLQMNPHVERGRGLQGQGLIVIIEIIVIVKFLQLFRSGELSEACVSSGGAQRE